MEKSVRDLKFYITLFGHFFQTFAFLGDFRNCPKNKLPTLFSRIFKAHYEIIIPTTTTNNNNPGRRRNDVNLDQFPGPRDVRVVLICFILMVATGP